MDLQEKYLQKVKFYYDENGLLTQYPTKKPLREIVLSRIAEKIQVDKEYTENEINQIINNQIAFSDIELIRRELFDWKFIDRLRNGSKYWKNSREPQE